MVPLFARSFLGICFIACNALINPPDRSGLHGPSDQFWVSSSGQAGFLDTDIGHTQLAQSNSSHKQTLQEKFLWWFSQRTENRLLSIEDTCSTLNVGSVGCLRVKTYLGKTILDLQEPLHLKLKVDTQHIRNWRGAVTTKKGLDNPLMDQGQNQVCWEYASAFKHVPTDIGDKVPFIIASAADEAYVTPFKYPTLVRPAPVPDPSGNHVIVKLDRHRHEDPVEQVSGYDIPFRNKLDFLVWRGGATGTFKPSPCTGQYPNRSRALFVQKYRKTSDARINVGFSKSFSWVTLPDSSWVRGSMDMTSQLKYKFIMVVEGNAESSSMEWVMSSNSVPFMASPSVQTWSLHSWLVPWKHYIPVEPDFSDVSAKLDWAISNPTEAAQIASDGATFMNEFTDKDREDRINAAVLVTYFDRIRIEDTPVETSLIGTATQECDGLL